MMRMLRFGLGLRARAPAGAAPTPVPGFSPADLAPVVWQDASDPSTIMIDGNNRVSQWMNKGTKGGMFVQQNAASQPLYMASDARAGGEASISNTANGQSLSTYTTQGGMGTVLAREFWFVVGFGTGSQATFTAGTIGWGDGYAGLLSTEQANGNPRIMGEINQPSLIASSAIISTRQVFKGRNPVSSQTAVLPLPVSVLRIVGDTTMIDAFRVLLNQGDRGARGWNGPLLQHFEFTNPVADNDRPKMYDWIYQKYPALAA